MTVTDPYLRLLIIISEKAPMRSTSGRMTIDIDI